MPPVADGCRFLGITLAITLTWGCEQWCGVRDARPDRPWRIREAGDADSAPVLGPLRSASP